MTDNEMRTVIAEQCGWIREPCPGCTIMYHARWSKDFGKSVINSQPLCDLPDYPNDLNAMAEAVKTLETGFDGSQADDYQQTLWSIVNPGVQWEQPLDEPQPLYDVGYLQNMLEATARQRAEAFLRTIGKWKE